MTTVNKTVARIRDWLDNHAGLRLIEPRLIARDLRGIAAPSVTNALMVLVHEGALVLVYKVVSPSGAYADGEFTDPRDVPPRLPDRFEQYFDTADADIQPVFKRGL